MSPLPRTDVRAGTLTAARLLETDRRQECTLTLPNLQLAFTLSGWPSSQLLEVVSVPLESDDFDRG